MSVVNFSSLSTTETPQRCGKYWEMYGRMCRWARSAEDEHEVALARREARVRMDAYADGLTAHLGVCEQCRRWLASFQTNKEIGNE